MSTLWSLCGRNVSCHRCYTRSRIELERRRRLGTSAITKTSTNFLPVIRHDTYRIYEIVGIHMPFTIDENMNRHAGIECNYLTGGCGAHRSTRPGQQQGLPPHYSTFAKVGAIALSGYWIPFYNQQAGLPGSVSLSQHSLNPYTIYRLSLRLTILRRGVFKTAMRYISSIPRALSLKLRPIVRD